MRLTLATASLAPRLLISLISLVSLAPALSGCSSRESASEPSTFPRTEDANAGKPSAATVAEESEESRKSREDSAPRDSMAPQDHAALASAAYLVWGRARGAGERGAGERGAVDVAATTTYGISAGGAIVAEVPAAVFATDGRLYRWDVRPVEVARRPCRERLDEGDGVEPEQVRAAYDAWKAEREDLEREPTRTVDRAELVELGSGARKTVSELRLDQAGEGDLMIGANDFSFGVTLVGSTGSLLFVRESTWVDSCGAHGNAFSAAGVIDLANDAKVTDVGTIAPRALRKARERAEKQFERLRKEWEGEAEDDTELVELLPQYDARGTLSFLGRFATFAPYAFSSGDWGSYTMATTIPLRAFPERLTRTPATPPAVRALLQAKPGFAMGGYSAVATAK